MIGRDGVEYPANKALHLTSAAVPGPSGARR